MSQIAKLEILQWRCRPGCERASVFLGVGAEESSAAFKTRSRLPAGPQRHVRELFAPCSTLRPVPPLTHPASSATRHCPVTIYVWQHATRAFYRCAGALEAWQRGVTRSAALSASFEFLLRHGISTAEPRPFFISATIARPLRTSTAKPRPLWPAIAKIWWGLSSASTTSRWTLRRSVRRWLHWCSTPPITNISTTRTDLRRPACNGGRLQERR